MYGVHYPPKLHLDVDMADIINTGLGNTDYALHITEAYDDFETESYLHKSINVDAKHYVLECIFTRRVIFCSSLAEFSCLLMECCYGNAS
ncbi:hypothetical protein N665_0332s0049 [Sinapis alba]|nr:hypothetical protein N665_0332s0049 [Sinapis alba]